ncbi:MAG: S24 family peptidase [Sphingomonadales bacterium]|nr:S24 family peptidase [Sphingomonadales bacterium]
MEKDNPRAVLDRLIGDNGDDYAGLSKLIGKNAAYIQQYIKRGSPRFLGERERGILARYYGVDEKILGAPVDKARLLGGLRLMPKLDIGASAGAGALTDEEWIAGQIGFDEKWLKKMAGDISMLSLIRVQGDSMAPTLLDGDDIMVDRGAAQRPLRDGVHVIRMDDVLMVKRLAKGPAGHLSVLSDNSAYPDWPDVAGGDVAIIGRVVWTGRRL